MFRLKLSALYSRFLFVFFQVPLLVSGQATAAASTIYERLTQQEGAKITLELDITSIAENRKTDLYFPAMLTTEDGKSYKIEVKPRGKYRRKISEIPPLKLKFKKKTLVADGLDTLNEIKLVLPTIDNSQGDELIVKEYLAYRLFERLGVASVRARLIKLNLRDSHVEKSRSMLAILVEDEEETVARLNGKLVEQYGLPADSMLMDQAGVVAMFEYMIGNTDWDISMMRNVRLVEANESGKVCVIPYDFDFSGLVSAPYASPSSESGLRTVRDRFLMANGITPEALKRGVQLLRACKKDFYDLCRSKYLSKVAAADMIAYLETFYNAVELKDEVPATLRMPTD